MNNEWKRCQFGPAEADQRSFIWLSANNYIPEDWSQLTGGSQEILSGSRNKVAEFLPVWDSEVIYTPLSHIRDLVGISNTHRF